MRFNHFLFVLLIILAVPRPLHAQVQKNVQTEVKIGVILPLTGDSAFWGVNPQRGIMLALEDLLATKGLHYNFNLIYEDDQCDPARAVAAFHRLVDFEQVKIILGPACSSSTVAVAPLAKEKKILLASFSEADSARLPNAQFLRLWVPNSQQARRLAKHIKNSEHMNSLAILSVKNAYGEDFSAVL